MIRRPKKTVAERKADERKRRDRGYRVLTIVIREPETWLEILRDNVGLVPRGHPEAVKDQIVKSTEQYIEHLCQQHRWQINNTLLRLAQDPAYKPKSKPEGHAEQLARLMAAWGIKTPGSKFEDRLWQEEVHGVDPDDPPAPETFVKGSRKPSIE